MYLNSPSRVGERVVVERVERPEAPRRRLDAAQLARQLYGLDLADKGVLAHSDHERAPDLTDAQVR